MTDTDRSKSLSPDDALPPVEPPSAGFLVQLFVIPMLIVGILVVGWLFVQWLVQSSNNPRDYVRRLRGNSEVRWQAAVNLASALSNPQNDLARHDAGLARELSQILLDNINVGSLEESDLRLREYLCVALGHFANDAGRPALLKAASTSRDPKEDDVRLAAIYGLGELAQSIHRAGGDLPDDAAVFEVLDSASKSDEPLLRGAAALALGGWNSQAAVDRLVALLDDIQPRVRYAAAAALARLGNPRAVDALVEMLAADAPTSDAATSTSGQLHIPTPDEIAALPNLIGLKAVAQLIDANPQADLSQVVPAVERLTKSTNPEVRNRALTVKEKLDRRTVEVQ